MKFCRWIKLAVLPGMSCTLIAAEPGLETAKQVLDAQWQKLRPNYAKERNAQEAWCRVLTNAGRAGPPV